MSSKNLGVKISSDRKDADRVALAEDKVLVRGMLAGDERAFERFSDEVLPRVYRFVGSRLRGQPDLVAEIVQSTVCKAIAKLDTWLGDATLQTWLCACSRYEIALYFRTKSRSPRFVEMSEGVQEIAFSAPQSAMNPETISLEQESRNRVHHTLDSLPARYGRVLEWKYLEQVSVKEIARRLETTPKAAESLLTRARNAFRDRYERVETETRSKPLPFPRLQNDPVSTP
jgi:RNA polymerase sigma-70 factor (ECF subfamily)